METLIENTVRVTIKHSDSEPIASVATTASVNREQATGAERPLKPQAPCDRIMAEFLQCAGESPVTYGNFAGIAGNIGAGRAPKWQNDGETNGFARYFSNYARYSGCLKPRRRSRLGRRRQRPGANPW